MANMSRVRTSLTGFAGAPGVSTMYFLGTAPPVFNVHSFWLAIKAFLPADVRVSVESAGDVIESTTGVLSGSWVGDPQADVQGTGPNGYSAASGALVRWETSLVADGHRVRGRTFIVPLDGASYNLIGSIQADTLTVLRSAGTALATDTASSFVVWHRPFAGSAAVGTRPARAAHAGLAVPVSGSTVPNEAVVLRSRRD